MESELAKPVVYDSCNSEEIQRKLSRRNFREMLRNTAQVSPPSGDACATHAECDSVHQATRNLDQRWRNICAVSTEKRLKIEETR